MRAAIYLRISQDRTGEQAGVRRQEDDCRDLAERLGWKVVDVYSDNDTSASTKKPRPQYRRMLDALTAGQIDAVLAWHTDRLYRRPSDLEELIQLVEGRSILIRTVRAGEMDLATPTGRMVARMLGAAHTQEVEHKADRWKRAFRQRREAGQVYRSGPRHFGYERDGTVNDAEAEILRWVSSEILSGVTVHTMCRRLDARGVRTTLGNTWRAPSLRLLLQSPRLAGLAAHRGEIVGKGNWEPILDRPTWESLRAAVDPKRGRPAPARMALLSEIAFCGIPDCGKRLYRSRRNNAPIYTCKRDPNQASGHIAVMAMPLEELVESYARRRLADPNVRRALAARLSMDGTAELVAQIDAIEAQIKELEQQLRETGRKRSAAAVRHAIDDLDEQLEAKRSRLTVLTPAVLPDEGTWPQDLERRAALIRLVVAKAWVDPAKIRGARFDNTRIRIDPTPEAT